MDEIIKAVNISKSYSTHKALENVSIDIPRQSIFGLLGPNGAGKTTLIRIITQIFAQDSGEIYFNGEKLRADHIFKMGYMPEERGLYKKMKVGEQLLYLARLKGLTRNEAMVRLRYWFQKFDIANWWNKHIEDLSKGMQQKVQFIATVLHKPELLILDEPFSGFDPINANLIKDEILKLKEEGITIIFSTHRMDSVEELCDNVALINKSHKILDGSKNEIKKRYKSNTFIVELKGDFAGLNGEYNLISQENLGEGMQRATIQMLNGSTPNHLILALMEKGEIYSIHEKVPTMNDIFISKVKEAGHE